MIEQKKKYTLSVKERIGKKYVIIDGDDTEEATPQNEMYEPVVDDKPVKLPRMILKATTHPTLWKS
jgi:hypothetical protein